jgi:hypothetical protein
MDKVSEMPGMFFNTLSFNQSLGGWDVRAIEWIHIPEVDKMFIYLLI